MGIAVMLLTPSSIRTLQRKLYRKAKQEPPFRFYSLYDKVYRADILNHAWRLVRSNRGSAGVDGVTFEDIEGNEGKDAFLAELEEALKSKTYKPEPVKRVMIPKLDGSKRPLGIPTIRDRVAQMAVKMVIEPIFEADFCDNSYGFRPKRSAHGAVDDITRTLRQGYTKVIDADLSKYFDTISHSNLMAVVAERICDKAIFHIIRQWLKAPVVETDENGKRKYTGGKGNRKGTPQGGVISPLLANLYLHLLDRIWERRQLQMRLGARLIRYADDCVVLCKWGTEKPMEMINYILGRLELTLNEKKTHIVNAYRESFDFLGFEFGMRRSRKTGRFYSHTQPSRKSLKKIKSRTTQLTKRNMTPLPIETVVRSVNLLLRGWVNYFHYGNSSDSFGNVKWHVEERVRTHLRKRYKIRSRMEGYKRLPTARLYNEYGLYKVPTTARWVTAHALR